MKVRLVPIALCLWPVAIFGNTAPTPVVVSATMRAGTTLMDVVYRVNDPDDATVKTRALAFVDGERSFAKVIRPVTFVEGTAAKLGNAIATNTNHTLTWDVAADWNTDVGQLKFEVLAMDGRGLLPIDWITIPAAAGKPALTISKDAPTDAAVLDALFWRYADGDTGLLIENGVLRGNAASGVFAGVQLVNGNTVQAYAAPFVFKRMNLAVANEEPSDMSHATNTARADLLNPSDWHAFNKPYNGISIVVGWGNGYNGDTAIPKGLAGVTAITGSRLVLRNDKTVFSWGGVTTPTGLKDVTAISAFGSRYFAIKDDRTVVGWYGNGQLQTDIPAGLSNVTGIAGMDYQYAIALKGDGTVVGWAIAQVSGNVLANPPSNLNGVVKISANNYHCLALKNNGMVEYWNTLGESGTITDLTDVTAIAAGVTHNLALKSGGTVVGWGYNTDGAITIPSGLTDVVSIAVGRNFSSALKNDGTVVVWGYMGDGLHSIPSGLTGVSSIAIERNTFHALKSKAL